MTMWALSEDWDASDANGQVGWETWMSSKALRSADTRSMAAWMASREGAARGTDMAVLSGSAGLRRRRLESGDDMHTLTLDEGVAGIAEYSLLLAKDR